VWKKKGKVPNAKRVFVFFFVFLGEKMDPFSPSHHIISAFFFFLWRIFATWRQKKRAGESKKGNFGNFF
jgi:hypothetical protein